jgi:MinD superfamily P-loop ATPase
MKIAIASGKGGTGKTLLSTNLFYTLSEHHASLCLVDCDAEEPNDLGFFETQLIEEKKVTQKVPVIDESRCKFCGKCHDYCAYNAIFIIPPAKVIKVIDDLCHGCGACTVACRDGAISERDDLLGGISIHKTTNIGDIIESRVKVGVYSPVKVIKAGIKASKKYEIVILDSPPGTSCPFIHTVESSDYVILVTEPTPFGLSDLKQSVDTLKTMNKNYGVIINRAGLGNREIYDYLDEDGIPLLMEIPFDKEIARIYSTGKLLAKERPEFKEELKKMFDKISSDYGNSHH